MERNDYNTMYTEVLVFKTNISSEYEIERLKELFAYHENIIRWNVDRQDVDKVLRIECGIINPITIVNLLRNAGFECEELPD
jgi:hypothetical protein